MITLKRTLPKLPEVASRLPGFRQFRENVRRKVDRKNLTQSELNSLALLDYVQRRHSAFFPSKPEFPPLRPRFPATPTKEIRVPGLENIRVLVKDESINPTGTHKDRLAWEVVREWHKQLRMKARTGKPVPRMSIISSGNAAIAIGDMLRTFGAPPIKVLGDERLDHKVIEKMKRHNVEVHTADLSRRVLTSDRILKLTRNGNGVDLTNGRLAQFLSRDYYDWMTFEILNEKPDFVVVPYGTGQLFENIFEHYDKQLKELRADPRLRAEKMREGGLNLVGIAAPAGSVADKLSAPYLPESSKVEFKKRKRNVITQLISEGVLGEHSRIEELEDRYFFDAARIAQQLKIKAEPSSLAGLAWLLKHKTEVPPKSRVLIVNTGKGVFPED